MFDREIIVDIKKEKPLQLSDEGMFLHPNGDKGGGLILNGSGINYSDDVHENHGASEHIILQFIADTQLAAYRPIVETWKFLRKKKEAPYFPIDRDNEDVYISGFYTGFQRLDRRGWLGFHEGVSNLKPEERLDCITINNSNIVNSRDSWTMNGTYLCYLRIAIDLEAWENITPSSQALIVGRDKLTGCPIRGVDRNGNAVVDRRCPVPGTHEIIDKGNEPFREHPPFGNQTNLPEGVTDNLLNQSHIGRARRINNMPAQVFESLRIFRQGSEFIESTSVPPFFRVGLNFVSFQNSPQTVVGVLTNPLWLGRTNFGGDPDNPLPGMSTFQSVRAAGFFYIPPLREREPFPGACIFI